MRNVARFALPTEARGFKRGSLRRARRVGVMAEQPYRIPVNEYAIRRINYGSFGGWCWVLHYAQSEVTESTIYLFDNQQAYLVGWSRAWAQTRKNDDYFWGYVQESKVYLEPEETEYFRGIVNRKFLPFPTSPLPD